MTADEQAGFQAAENEHRGENWMQLCRAVASFIDDPPDSQFQYGYLAYLRQRLHQLTRERKKAAA